MLKRIADYSIFDDKLPNGHADLLNKKAKQLEGLGYIVHRVPATFYFLKTAFFSFTNGITGLAPETGKPYLITSSSGIGVLDKAFKEQLESLGYTVHFVEGTEALLWNGKGGLGCITLQSIRPEHEPGPATSPA